MWLVWCGIKLSRESVFKPYNLARLCFFVPLILAGYMSVVCTVYELVLGVAYIGDRPDIIAKQ